MRSASGELNAYDFLQGLQHFSGTRCARRKQFEEISGAWLHSYPFSLQGLRDAMSEWETETADRTVCTDVHDLSARRARNEVLATLSFVESWTDDTALNAVSSFAPSVEQLETYAAKSIDFYASRGLIIEVPKIRILDTLPDPFTRTQISILAIDGEDHRRFGLDVGLYFTPRAVTPLFAEYSIAHELVHTYLGSVTPEVVCDFFEEGVADLVSIFDYMRFAYGSSVARNTMLMHRLTSAHGLGWDNYVDGSRAALALCLDRGPDSLYKAIISGRHELLNLQSPGPRGRQSLSVEGFGDSLVPTAVESLLRFPRERVVSALAYEVALYAEPGLTVREIAHQAQISIELTEEGLAQLEEFGYVVRRPDGIVIEFAPVGDYIERGELRYDFR